MKTPETMLSFQPGHSLGGSAVWSMGGEEVVVETANRNTEEKRDIFGPIEIVDYVSRTA
jgi:hypothetical protein